jgi:hypothetical protein
MCCGRSRLALRNNSTSMKAPSGAPQVQQSGSNRAFVPAAPGQNQAARSASISARALSLFVTLHYTETAAIRVWGPVTGRQYDFSGAQPAQAVDPRDAHVLTRSGLFRPA